MCSGQLLCYYGPKSRMLFRLRVAISVQHIDDKGVHLRLSYCSVSLHVSYYSSSRPFAKKYTYFRCTLSIPLIMNVQIG